jgi:hypothetical protein
MRQLREHVLGSDVLTDAIEPTVIPRLLVGTFVALLFTRQAATVSPRHPEEGRSLAAGASHEEGPPLPNEEPT